MFCSDTSSLADTKSPANNFKTILNTTNKATEMRLQWPVQCSCEHCSSTLDCTETSHGSSCDPALHCIHRSCPQRHVSAEYWGIHCVVPSCRVGDNTSLHTISRRSTTPQTHTKNTVNTEKSERGTSTCSDLYKTEVSLCLLSSGVTVVGVSSIRSPAVSVQHEFSSVIGRNTTGQLL